MTADLKKFSNGEVYFWIEQGSSIHIKAATEKYNDPVELTADEAKEIGQELIKVAEKLNSLDNKEL